MNIRTNRANFFTKTSTETQESNGWECMVNIENIVDLKGYMRVCLKGTNIFYDVKYISSSFCKNSGNRNTSSTNVFKLQTKISICSKWCWKICFEGKKWKLYTHKIESLVLEVNVKKHIRLITLPARVACIF